MRIRILFLGLTILLLFGTIKLQAQSGSDTTKNILDKGKLELKLKQARHEYLKNNFRGALNKSREVLAKDKDNPKAHFMIAQCHYKLGHYEMSDEHLRKSEKGKKKIGDNYYLLRGKTYHRMEKLDSALMNFEKYKSILEEKTLPKDRKIEYTGVQKYIEQCKFAKEQMKDSLHIAIENMGRRVNSRYDEYTPCVTEDGKKMLFTSRRPDTKGGGIDKRGDHQYFEDIYFTEYDTENEQWTRPEGIPGRVNTVMYDAILSLSPNGKVMYVYRNNSEHAGDIYRAEMSDRTGKWRRPKLLPKPVNTSFYEGSITATKGEEKIFFISERKGGHGQGDIYMSKKKGHKEWSEPKNLGPMINTSDDEKFVHVHPNGKTLFFASNGHPSLGSYDIYKTELVDGEWTKPVNLGYPINTVNEESTFSLTPDYKKLFLAGKFKRNYGRRDIYRVDLKGLDILVPGMKKKTHGVISGTVVNEENGSYIEGCKVIFKDVESGEKVGETTTGKKGKYSMRLKGDKTYDVIAKADGYKRGSVQVKLKLKEREESEYVEHFTLKKE